MLRVLILAALAVASLFPFGVLVACCDGGFRPGPVPVDAPAITIPAEVKVKVDRLTKISAESATPVKWVNLSDDISMIPSETGKWVIIQAHKPGRYKLAAYTATKDGPSEPAYCLIVAEGDSPPAPMPPVPPAPPAPKPSPMAALGRLRFAGGGCTATVVSPRRGDGRWDILTAAHCTGGAGSKGTFTLKDGRTLGVSVSARNTKADICWLVTDSAALEDLPYASLAVANPPAGCPVWHAGYGIDKPGNVEEGTYTSGPNSDGQYQYSLSVSPGDSGGGIFRKDTGELLSPVCCTAGLATKTRMWGGSPLVAAGMRPKVPGADLGGADRGLDPLPWVPVPLPVYPD